MNYKTPDTNTLKPAVVVQHLTTKTKGLAGQNRLLLRAPKLDDISFFVMKGEAVGILGTAQDGAIILGETITGRLKPAAGRIYVQRSSSFLGAPSSADLELSVSEAIQRFAMTQDVNGRALGRAVERTSRQIGLSDDQLLLRLGELDSHLIDLIRVSASINASPSVIVTSSSISAGNVLLLDPGKTWFERFISRGGAAVVIDQSTKTMVRSCSRIIWLHEGKIIMDREAIEVHREFQRFQSAKDDRILQAQFLRRYSNEYVRPEIVTH